MQPNGKINVVILDDHQSIVDGYVLRLGQNPQIEVVASVNFGDDLEPALEKFPADVLILDINVPISAENAASYPILHIIPKLLQLYPRQTGKNIPWR